jgi:type I restriction enzyme M protein
MAIKKSELYSSLWASCDALRGGMDASQYKDYVLVLLFIKYVSDKYANDPYALIVVPEGGSFKDIAALKGQKDIGEKIDTVIGALAKANDLENVIDLVSFNDEEKLGKDKEMVDRLTELVSIFQQDGLDFSKNRAAGDDILGDAYEYLMRNFATESGKSKGQFYTPAEVSRVMAKILGVSNATPKTSMNDPTCGSGSLLLKLLDEAGGKGTLYGQEKDVATAGLARMNMILHNAPTADIRKGQSTLSNPLFLDENGNLRTFDYVVANPPFSLANWTQGFNPREDEHNRFTHFGIPPEKNGDYAFLLHIVATLKSTGKAAVILPHGVLFRGGSEATIRKALVKRGYIKGIIGLAANLFYGTGIPACIIVIDKEEAATRKGIFMIDASKGYIKDGNKNRLRDQDIHKIVDVFNKQLDIPKYSRLIPYVEIADPKNDFNLNIPRYIDTQEPEDLQDIAAHLFGGIPDADINALEPYWDVYPNLRKELFTPADRPGYSHLMVEKENIKNTIFHHFEFLDYRAQMDNVFNQWSIHTAQYLKSLDTGLHPVQLIRDISENLLKQYDGAALLDKYDVYQHLMNYWAETMQDDTYMIASDGWKAEVYRVIIENKKTGTKRDKGWACDLLPGWLVVKEYLAKEKTELDALEAQRESLTAELSELEEEHSTEEGYFAGFEKMNKALVQKRLKELKSTAKVVSIKKSTALYMAAEEESFIGTVDDGGIQNPELTEEEVLEKYLSIADKITDLGGDIKRATEELDRKTLAIYPTLTEEDIKHLVVDCKWMVGIEAAIGGELDRISQRLTQRIKELGERYDATLPMLNEELKALESKVAAHLEKMGFGFI